MQLVMCTNIQSIQDIYGIIYTSIRNSQLTKECTMKLVLCITLLVAITMSHPHPTPSQQNSGVTSTSSLTANTTSLPPATALQLTTDHGVTVENEPANESKSLLPTRFRTSVGALQDAQNSHEILHQVKTAPTVTTIITTKIHVVYVYCTNMINGVRTTMVGSNTSPSTQPATVADNMEEQTVPHTYRSSDTSAAPATRGETMSTGEFSSRVPLSGASLPAGSTNFSQGEPLNRSLETDEGVKDEDGTNDAPPYLHSSEEKRNGNILTGMYVFFQQTNKLLRYSLYDEDYTSSTSPIVPSVFTVLTGLAWGYSLN